MSDTVKFLRVGPCCSHVSDIVNEQVCVKHVSYLHFLRNYSYTSQYLTILKEYLRQKS